MENIIKTAIAGGYRGVSHRNQEGRCTGVYVLKGDDIAWVVLDPLFWQALGKARGWTDKYIKKNNGSFIYGGKIWLNTGLTFHRINLTEGWDAAIIYLKELIK